MRPLHEFAIYSKLLGSDVTPAIEFLADWALLTSVSHLHLVLHNSLDTSAVAVLADEVFLLRIFKLTVTLF